jgi:high affinity Mn2+ porin
MPNHEKALRYLLALVVLATCPLPAQDAVSETFWDRFWVSLQGNFIRQQHGDFEARYSGPNSLSSSKEHATSRVETLYLGFQITKRLEILTDVESAGGAGLSNALGVAGFMNVDVVRNPALSEDPYISRVMLHYTLPLSKETTEATRNPLSLASTVATRRLEFRIGKMSTVDFFDLNSVGSDSHLQFMNWAIVNNGAYDYAADTRGYTYGFLAEYYSGNFGARFGEMLMPDIANGIRLDWDLVRARGENFEAEYHAKHGVIVRPLAFVNHANMGSYQEAINSGPNPDITLVRRQGGVKYVFGLNAEQQVIPLLRAFERLGWSDGRNESFAYTEIDRTAQFGADFRGKPWRRGQDKIAGAFVINGLSSLHRQYLALGGDGFILGDGGLNYGHEQIFETYYTAHVYRGVSVAADYQHVTNPGYNQDRGPVSVVSFRIHFEDAIPFDKFH